MTHLLLWTLLSPFSSVEGRFLLLTNVPRLLAYTVSVSLIMQISYIAFVLSLGISVFAKVFDRQALTYAPIPEGTYKPPNKPGETTLLDLIKSSDELSVLATIVYETPGRNSL